MEGLDNVSLTIGQHTECRVRVHKANLSDSAGKLRRGRVARGRPTEPHLLLRRTLNVGQFFSCPISDSRVARVGSLSTGLQVSGSMLSTDRRPSAPPGHLLCFRDITGHSSPGPAVESLTLVPKARRFQLR